MPGTPFDSLDDYIALPRTEALALSPDGTRAVLAVATLNADGTAFDRALWQIAVDGARPPQRITRSVKGESAPAYTAGGDVLFLSARPDGTGGDAGPAQLWLLPADGGEARPVTRLAGGVDAIEAVAEASDVVIVSAPLLPGADGVEDDARRRADRDKHKVTAILHEAYPVRFWDHDLGPAQPHLLALHLDELSEPLGVERVDADADGDGDGDKDAVPYPSWLPRPHDLTPHPGLRTAGYGTAVTPDGATVVAALAEPEGSDRRARLVSIDVASGAHTVLHDEPGVDNETPVISHGGTHVAWLRQAQATSAGPTDLELWVGRIDGAPAQRMPGLRRVAVGWDRWPTGFAFDADDRSLVATADQDGRGPVFRIPLTGGAVAQLTHDDFTYSLAHVDRHSGAVVALRANWMAPPHPVRIDADRVTVVPAPAPLPDVPATMVEVDTTAADGARVRGWLMLPERASADAPAPLVLWIHGGPMSSWNAWSWRWNPQLLVAHGYAVLLPDPGLSTGYGLDFLARGWNDWGGTPFTDLMAVVDAVATRPDIDREKTAAMGGSFGGYMANWVVGHTDRFRAVVTHAGLWALDQFAGTTDVSGFWRRIFTPEAMAANSPHRFVRDIRTPLLVIHGDSDYRVPIGEALRLWSELNEHAARPDGTLEHKFLYFPDENHWVLKPQHTVVWYQTVLAFLDRHVRDGGWVRPDRLG